MQSKKTLFTFLFIAGTAFSKLYAQESPVASGGDATGSGGSSSYSVGQVVYTANSGTTGTVAQGVQQPYEISTVTGKASDPSINLYASAFPNPTVDFVTLKTLGSTGLHLAYQLYNLDGKLIESGLINSDETHIVMSSLASSTYLLKVMDAGSEVKTFKIIKNK